MTGSAQAVGDVSDATSTLTKRQQPRITDIATGQDITDVQGPTDIRPQKPQQPRIYDSNTLADITDVQGPTDPRSSAPFPGQSRQQPTITDMGRPDLKTQPMSITDMETGQDITGRYPAARPSAPSTRTRAGARALGRAVTRVAAPVGTAIDFGMAGNRIGTEGDIYGADQRQFAADERAGRVPGRGILDPLNQDSISQKAGTFVSRVGSGVADRIRSTAGRVVDDVKSGRVFAPGGLSRSMANAAMDNVTGVVDTLASGFSRGSSRELDNTQSTGSMREPDAIAQGKPLTMADRARLVAQRTGAGTRELEIRRERGAKAADKATQSQPDRASESEIGRDPNNPDAPREFRRQYKRDIPSPFDR